MKKKTAPHPYVVISFSHQQPIDVCKYDSEAFVFQVSRALAVSQLILASAILLMSVYEKPGPMGTIMAILASGILAYLFGVLWKPKPTALDRCIGMSYYSCMVK